MIVEGELPLYTKMATVQCSLSSSDIDLQWEEILTLEAVYGEEFALISNRRVKCDKKNDDSGQLLAFSITRQIEVSGKVTILFKLPRIYPKVAPEIDIKCNYNVSSELLETCWQEAEVVSQSYNGECCLYQVAEAIFSTIMSEHGRSESGDVPDVTRSQCDGVKQGTPPKAVEHATLAHTNCVCVVSLDHMHNATLYKKNLSSWSVGLETCTMVEAGRHCLLVVLTGPSREIESFLQTWKTQNVDVDSRGRPCKERMMTIVCKEVLSRQLQRIDHVKYIYIYMYHTLILQLFHSILYHRHSKVRNVVWSVYDYIVCI